MRIVRDLISRCDNRPMQNTRLLLSSFRNRRAFSLIELVIVLAIIGILAAMAVPHFADAAIRNRIDIAAKRIAADLELARKHAIHSSTPQTVTFNGNGYEISGMRDLDRSTSSYKVDLSDEPYRAQIRSADFDGDSEINFDTYGNADSGGTVVLQVARSHRTVKFDSETGQATVE